jgi:transcription initiation factor TFIIIB Brf1 subunit/transcription initiation factor TFIIB
MQPPEEPEYDESMMCPECGSTEVELTEDNEYVIEPGHCVLHEYKCKDCGTKFFPAMESEKKTHSEKLIEKWSRKVDYHRWSDQKRHKKEQKYIIVRKKK